MAQPYSAETFGGITLINADCMDVLRDLPDEAFDLAIVDPPYGINAPNMTMGTAPKKTKSGDGISVAQRLKKGRLNSGGGKLKNRALNSMSLTWDCERPSPEYFAELFRVSRNQIIWGGNYYDLPPTRGVICWDKVQPWDNFSQWEMAWTSFDRTARLFRYSSRGGGERREENPPHPETGRTLHLVTFHLCKARRQYNRHTFRQLEHCSRRARPRIRDNGNRNRSRILPGCPGKAHKTPNATKIILTWAR